MSTGSEREQPRLLRGAGGGVDNHGTVVFTIGSISGNIPDDCGGPGTGCPPKALTRALSPAPSSLEA